MIRTTLKIVPTAPPAIFWATELFDRTDEFSRRLEEFRKNPLVDAFLNAELDFCRMIQEINGKIVEAVNFE